MEKKEYLPNLYEFYRFNVYQYLNKNDKQKYLIKELISIQFSIHFIKVFSPICQKEKVPK
jgi:hypothetical protein